MKRPRQACRFGEWLRSATVLACLTVVGCTQPTAYEPANGAGGFTEQQIEQDRFRVSFVGNIATSRETVENYVLLRAAEVTVQTDHDYFIVLDRQTERTTTYRGGPIGYTGFGTIQHHDRFSRPYYRPYYYGPTYLDPIDSYESWAVIWVRSGAAPGDDPSVYDARDVIRNLVPAPTGDRS